MYRVLPGVCLFLALGAPGFAATYVVSPDGTGDFPTIQAAIDATVDGDVIELTDGTFTGEGNRDLDYLGRAITIRSQNGVPEVCVIDCEGTETDPHRGLHFRSGEGAAAVLTGVTITNGWAEYEPGGGAVLCQNESSPALRDCIFAVNGLSAVRCEDSSNPTFEDCLFERNHGWEGGALSCCTSSPEVQRCDFIENDADWHGGAFCGQPSSASFTGCRFLHNTGGSAGAVTAFYGTDPLFRDCWFEGNSSPDHGAAAMLLFCFVTGRIEGCTFVGNSTVSASVVGTGKMSHLQVRNCTFWGNSVPNGVMIAVGELDATIDNTVVALNTAGGAVGGDEHHPIVLSCCDLYGNPGGDWVGHIADQLGIRGNISEDPLFCDPENGDLTLRCESPCAPFSPPNPECDLIGAWPVGCGASPTIESSWGAVKALFRE